MALTLASRTDTQPRVRPEPLSKVTLRKAENDLLTPLQDELNPAWVDFGTAIDRARRALGWTLKELTAAIATAQGIERDERQVSRWVRGIERPQLEVIWLVVAMRRPFIVALAEVEGMEVETVLRIGRSA